MICRSSLPAFRLAQIDQVLYEEVAMHCVWLDIDEAEGYEEEDIEPGTRWEDVPDDFVCPECGVGKDDFEMIEIG